MRKPGTAPHLENLSWRNKLKTGAPWALFTAGCASVILAYAGYETTSLYQAGPTSQEWEMGAGGAAAIAFSGAILIRRSLQDKRLKFDYLEVPTDVPNDRTEACLRLCPAVSHCIKHPALDSFGVPQKAADLKILESKAENSDDPATSYQLIALASLINNCPNGPIIDPEGTQHVCSQINEQQM